MYRKRSTTRNILKREHMLQYITALNIAAKRKLSIKYFVLEPIVNARWILVHAILKAFLQGREKQCDYTQRIWTNIPVLYIKHIQILLP